MAGEGCDLLRTTTSPSTDRGAYVNGLGLAVGNDTEGAAAHIAVIKCVLRRYI